LLSTSNGQAILPRIQEYITSRSPIAGSQGRGCPHCPSEFIMPLFASAPCHSILVLQISVEQRCTRAFIPQSQRNSHLFLRACLCCFSSYTTATETFPFFNPFQGYMSFPSTHPRTNTRTRAHTCTHTPVPHLYTLCCRAGWSR